MPALPPSEAPLERILNWAAAQPEVRLVLLTSTRAIPGGRVDALSDYDLILVVEDIHPFVEHREWLAEFGVVLVAYWDPVHPEPQFGLDVCANVIQYRSMLKLDFTLWPVSLFKRIVDAAALPAELDAGFRVLLDKDHMAGGLPLPTGKAYVPPRPSQDEYQLLVNDFLSDAPYVAKCLWRGELLPARWCLDYDMKYVYLLPLLAWRAEIDRGWSAPVGYLGKGLRSLLPGDLWCELESTYASSSTQESWQALFRTLQLFRRVAVEVGANLGYAYPEEQHQRVLEYIQHIERMEHLPAVDDGSAHDG